MLALENAEEVLQILDRYTKQKSKDIPPELDEYLNYVAKTGDTVYRWPTVQYLFREKLINVIKEFHDTTASIEDLPQCPNVDQFNYESMKSALIEKLERFQAAPFTVQRLCELLTDPKKHYSRLDKFMRALEKNILVVSTVEPGRKPTTDGEENGDEPMNGVILSENNIEAVSKENNKMDEEANGSAETIDTVASKLTEESAPEAAPTAEPAAAIDREKPIEADAKEANSIEVDATASEEPIAVIEAPVVDDAIKDGGDIASEEPATVAATDVVTENKTDDDKVLVDEAKPEEIAQIIESLDLPPAAVEKIEKPSTPKHARDEDDDLDGELENGERSAKKIKLDLNDDIDAAITSLPESEIPVVEPKANGDKIDDEPIAEPTPIVDVPVEAAKIEAPTDAKIETIEKASVAEPVVEPVVEAPIEATPKTDAVEEVVAPEPTPAEEIAVDATKTEPVIESETPVVDSSAIEPAVTAEIAPVPTTPATEPVEEPAVVEPKPIDDVVVEDEPAKIEPSVEPDAQVPVKPVEAVTAEPEPVETAAPEVAPTLDIPVSEFLAENLTALIPTDLLPAVNESDMAPAVVAPEPNVINQESMTVEEPETPVAPIDEVVEENAEKMDAAPINDEQMDVDDAADPPMDL